MASAAAAAASAAAGATAAATVAAAVGGGSDTRSCAAAVAAAAVCGGLGGFLVWRGFCGSPARLARDAADEVAAAERRALSAIDAIHAKQAKRSEDSLDEAGHCKEIERLVTELRGGPTFVPLALRLAARAQQLDKDAVRRSDFPDTREGHLQFRTATRSWQRRRLMELLFQAGVSDETVDRACRLVSKDLPAAHDPDMQTLQDASCLVFLGQELSQYERHRDADDGRLADTIQQTWRLMSSEAKAKAVCLEYTPFALGALLEGVAAAEGFEATSSPMVSPRLPLETVELLQQSWRSVDEGKLGEEFFERLFSEDRELVQVFNYPAARPGNVSKIVRLLLELLGSDAVPRIERVVHAFAALGAEFGKLRTAHLAPIKRALVRSVTAYAPPKDKRRTNQAWEAFFYAICAVAAPYLVLRDHVVDFGAATSSALPLPDAGTHAGFIAASGVSLLQMCLHVSERSQGGASAPTEVVGKLHESRDWLARAVMGSINAYCGLVSSCISVSTQAEPKSSSDPVQGDVATIELAERSRWLRRAAEVPLNVAEISVGTAVACLPCRRQVKRSLQPEWVAGVKLLRTATEISLRIVSLNLQSGANGARIAGGVECLEKRFAKLRDTEPPWEDLCDFA